MNVLGPHFVIATSKLYYRISSEKRRDSNKRLPQTSAAPLGIQIGISASL